jgi:predicted PurR-regulated permease PerM
VSLPVDTEFDRERLAWWLFVLAVGAVFVFVFYAFLGVFLLGLFIYYATRPIYRRFAPRIGSPTLAAISALLAIALPILVLLTYTVAVGAGQLSQLLSDSPNYARLLQPYFGEALVGGDPQELFTELDRQLSGVTAGSIGSIASAFATYLSAIAAGLIYLFVVLAVAFFLLRDDQKVERWFRSLVGEQSAAYAFARAVDRDLQTLYFGNILTAFAIAIVAAFTYNGMDLVDPAAIEFPAATLLGLLTGAGSLIPVIGIKLVYVPIALYLALQAALADPGLFWFPIAFAAITFVVVDTIPEVVLRPYISGRNLHIGLVMFAYILGPALFGWYGLFLAPLILVLGVQSARLILPDLVRGGSVSPDAVGDDPLDAGIPPGASPAGEVGDQEPDRDRDSTRDSPDSPDSPDGTAEPPGDAE